MHNGTSLKVKYGDLYKIFVSYIKMSVNFQKLTCVNLHGATEVAPKRPAIVYWHDLSFLAKMTSSETTFYFSYIGLKCVCVKKVYKYGTMCRFA
jgi:hypothetical protein